MLVAAPDRDVGRPRLHVEELIALVTNHPVALVRARHSVQHSRAPEPILVLHTQKQHVMPTLLQWSTHEATEAEKKTFAAGHDLMRQGWTGTLDQLADYLAKA